MATPLLKIGEFSQLAQVTIRTLRHYDEIGLLKPARIDRDSDYRYYSVEQLPRLNRILALKDLGFTLDQIAVMVQTDIAPAALRTLLLERQAELTRQVQAEQARLARVAARLRQIEHEGEANTFEVVLKQVPQQTIATIRTLVPTMAEMAPIRCPLFAEVYDLLVSRRIKLTGPELALYHADSYIEEDIDMEGAICIDSTGAAELGRQSCGRVQVRSLSPATLACVICEFSLWNVSQAFGALFTWISENGHTSTTPTREIHLFGHETPEVDFDHVLIELQMPIMAQ